MFVLFFESVGVVELVCFTDEELFAEDDVGFEVAKGTFVVEVWLIKEQKLTLRRVEEWLDFENGWVDFIWDWSDLDEHDF